MSACDVNGELTGGSVRTDGGGLCKRCLTAVMLAQRNRLKSVLTDRMKRFDLI